MTGSEGFIEYCVSQAVMKVLACSILDGDTPAGRFVERLAPDVVIARLISGMASSIRASSFLISAMIWRISYSCAARVDALVLLFRDSSSVLAAFARRVPRDCISQRRSLVKVTADSNVVFPLAELDYVSSPV